ncbi:MAG TPA: histidine phosphatase family protein [Polyangiaceae bacterium]|nr:histidine phosphatase family protein [Polyangiaceae bacterium]
MTVLLLIRHGETDAVGRRLVGRLPGVPLNARGREQAERLAATLKGVPLAAVYSSPLERAVETAEPIARAHGLTPVVRDGLNEADFGDWTGLEFRELGTRPDFRRWNEERSAMRPPRGEHVTEIQARLVRELLELARQHPDVTVAVVGHADPLRAAIASFVGLPSDLLLRIELLPASISALRIAPGGATLLCSNLTLTSDGRFVIPHAP